MSITVEVKKVEKVKPEANGPIFVQKTIGADTWLVMAQSAVQLEDEFANLYYTVQNQSNIFLQPPYHPQELKNLCQSNNVLNQCIEAMEVNIDGTGHEFVASDTIQAELEEKKKALKEKQRMDDYKASVQKIKDTHQQNTDNVNNLNAAAPGEVPQQAAPAKPIIPPPPQESLGDGIDPEEKKQATAFFAEPYPGLSFVSIRRKLRREIESVGYAYLEILRNLNGDLVGIRNIETHNVRMVKLDAPVLVTKTINRGGVDVEIQIWERQRRFAQRVALKQLVYYREYGTARQVNRNTGRWEIHGDKDKPDEIVAPEDRGTELLIFGVHPDITTPYFVPRWINEVPSVVGSRKAEEQNLEFLDAGAMPPAIIFVQGGTLAKESADQLRMYLSGKNKSKHRAVVVEAMSSSGSLESAGTVQVKVERFGAERAMDAMFLKYDESTEEHIRVGFRLPPLFLGKPADYNMATAVTAYMVRLSCVTSIARRATLPWARPWTCAGRGAHGMRDTGMTIHPPARA